MNITPITNTNAALMAQAEQLEQLSRFYQAEAEKALGVAKNLRALASSEGSQNDPKVDMPKPVIIAPRLIQQQPGRPTVDDIRRIQDDAGGQKTAAQ